MAQDRIVINRAPVLTLWAAIVAERLGFDREEAMSLGKAVAGLTAQSKGRRLGIFAPTPEALKKARKQKRAKEFWIEILGRHVPAINTPDGIRAEILALAAALILPFLRGAAVFGVLDPPPMIRLSSFSRFSIFSRIATACLSCWSDNSSRGLLLCIAIKLEKAWSKSSRQG